MDDGRRELETEGRRVTGRGREEPPPTLPSEAELKLLRELWQAGELSVRDLHARVTDTWPVRSTTVLKLLQRMYEKGLVRRRTEGRAHLYTAMVGQESVERRLVGTFLTSMLGGSVERLIQHALPDDAVAPGDLAEIRRILSRAER